MVGIVIVSHSRELADSIVEFTKMMAPEALIRAAGGDRKSTRLNSSH